MSNNSILKDTHNHHDALAGLQNKPFVRTKIIGGYDAYCDKNGVTRFGEVAFETENMIVLGGAQFTLEKLFGVNQGFKVKYLHELTDSDPGSNTLPRPKFKSPSGSVKESDALVCLFGVGIGGSGESMSSVKSVEYREREIFDMIPIRLTDEPDTVNKLDNPMYFGKVETDGKTAFYLKKFEPFASSDGSTISPIKVLKKDAEGDEDGAAVDDKLYTGENEAIETFIELTLKLSKNDVREYFESNIESARINSIGLFTGVKDGDDYTYCKLFSKLNINNEMLTLSKDLTIVYRIYTS